MTKLPKYKIIKTEGPVIVFFPQSLNITTISQDDFQDVKEAQLNEWSRDFLNRFKEKRAPEPSAAPSSGKRWLYKIMVDLTDNCNLDCRYCYASKYYRKQNMSNETIDTILEKFWMSDEIAGIDQVVFFGGEPLLNLRGMEYFIQRMEQLHSEGKIQNISRYSLITNGTIYSDKIAELLKKHNIRVMVSFDGPPELQDHQRPFRGTEKETGNGKSSYDTIAGNIRKMTADEIPVRVECTITQHTLDKGYNEKKLKDFFLSEFNLEKVAFVSELGKGEVKVKNFFNEFFEHKNIYLKALLDLNAGDEMFDIPYRLLMKQPLEVACGLGKSSFQVLANGDIYPCQLLAGMEEFKMTDLDSFNDSHFDSNNWTERYKKNAAKCESCWVKPLCKFCPARQHLEFNCDTLTDGGCVERKKLIEDLIIKVVELRKNPELWATFSRKLQKRADEMTI